MSNAIIGLGASLKLKVDADDGYVLIPGATMISVPFIEYAKIDATSLGSTSGLKESFPGMGEASEFTFECDFYQATYARLIAIRGKKKVGVVDVSWQITAPDNSVDDPATYTFSAYLTKVETSFEAESKVKLKVTAVPYGDVTVA